MVVYIVTLFWVFTEMENICRHYFDNLTCSRVWNPERRFSINFHITIIFHSLQCSQYGWLTYLISDLFEIRSWTSALCSFSGVIDSLPDKTLIEILIKCTEFQHKSLCRLYSIDLMPHFSNKYRLIFSIFIYRPLSLVCRICSLFKIIFFLSYIYIYSLSKRDNNRNK